MRLTKITAALAVVLATTAWVVGCTTSVAPEPTPKPKPPPEPEPTLCEVAGWTERPFLWTGAFGDRRRDLAWDFVVPELLADGTTSDWAFAENYLGCESYLFVPDTLRVSQLDVTPLLASDVDLAELIVQSPPNTHYFFFTMSSDEAEVAQFASAMAARIDGVVAGYDEGSRLWWRDHLHAVSRSGAQLDNWVSAALAKGGAGFAIDRFQHIRAFGNLADVTRYDPSLNSAGHWPWRSNLSYLAHEARYYGHESDRQDMLDAVDWDIVYLLYEEDVAGTGKNNISATLPDAAEMASYDTLLIDLSHVCDPNQREQGNCDAWDAVQALRLCDAVDAASCEVELARYITTYHREGRWLADASQLLPYLAAGGGQRFRLDGARQGHFVSLRLLFGNTGKGGAPYDVKPLWEGGNWSESYDDEHPPVQIAIPADAEKVYLHVVLSGHGQGGTNNCAEFCDHQHTFSVGAASYVAEHPNMGDQQGCLKQIDQGAVPNQFGTWWFERSSWCPGKQVDPWVWDITDQVTPGQLATISYTTNYGMPYFGGNIILRSWITSWK